MFFISPFPQILKEIKLFTMIGVSSKYSFSDFVNLKEQEKLNPQNLWPTSRNIPHQSKLIPTPIQIMEEPKLLQSAVSYLKKQHQKNQADAISDIQSLSSSNFMLSRQNTPMNPVPKKKVKHRTKNSELFEIQSTGSRKGHDERDEFNELVIVPRYCGLSDIIYLEAVGKERKVNPKLLHAWKDCLLHQDKAQIFGNNAPYSFSRIFPVNELEKGFSEIYGTGKKRTLRVGEESLLVSQMEKYLQKCDKQITKIARKDFDIISDILTATKLEELETLPYCMKQIELLWKVMATFWRFSGKLDFSNKTLESALINGRSNFLDLHKDSPLVQFVLASSNIQQIQINR